MNIFDCNLTKVLLAKEEKLKAKYGDNYLAPASRMLKEIIDDGILPEENELLPDLPFVEAEVA